MFQRFAENNNFGKELTKTIERTLQLASFNGGMLNTGLGAIRVECSDLAGWLIHRAFSTSARHAVEDLKRHVAADSNEGIEVLGAQGLKVNHKITVVEGVDLAPISMIQDPFTQFLLDPAACAPQFLACGVSRASAVLIRRCRFFPKFVANHERSTIERTGGATPLKTILMLFGLHENVAPLPGLSAFELNRNVPCSTKGNSGGTQECIESGISQTRDVNNDHISVVREFLPKLLAIPENRRKKFLRAIERISSARRRSRVEDQYLDIGIALEMLLLSDQSENSPIASQFRFRGSYLLGKTPEERKELSKTFNTIYTFRSKAAHEGKISISRKKKVPDPGKFVSTAISISCNVVKALLTLGDPDLSKAQYGFPLDEKNKSHSSE